MGHSAGFGYALWAIAQGLVIRYGPQRRIWLSAMGCGAVFGYALWAIAQNQLPKRRTRKQFLKACHIL
jgi:type IV secretory pathway TrbD component